MGALVCDICGGKLAMGTGGIAVCDSCGMEHTKERMQEKVQEIKGVVRIDNSHMTDSWVKMGNAAAAAGNHKEAYEYFTKVVEVDTENWRAIYEKGKAGAWQSTLGNLRTSEIYQGINSALEIINRSDMPEADVVGLKNEFAVALYNINNAITDLMEQNLNDEDDKYFDAHWDQMWKNRQRHLSNVTQLEDALGLISDLDDDLSKNNVIEFKKRMCADLRDACGFCQYWMDYSQTTLGYFGFKVKEKENYVSKYWDLVYEVREVEPNYASDKWSLIDPFNPPTSSNYDYNRTERIFEYWESRDHEKKEKNRKDIYQHRFDEYWRSHAHEKLALESEKNSLNSEISNLQNEINEIQDTSQRDTIEERLKSFFSDMSSLGLFRSKEKKAIQEQIDILGAELKAVSTKIDEQKAKINKRIEPLQKRIDEINNELTKER